MGLEQAPGQHPALISEAHGYSLRDLADHGIREVRAFFKRCSDEAHSAGGSDNVVIYTATLDTAPGMSAITELESLLLADYAAARSIVALVDELVLNHGNYLSFNGYPSTTGVAQEMAFVFEPADRLTNLLAAMRAGSHDGKGDVHGTSFVVNPAGIAAQPADGEVL